MVGSTMYSILRTSSSNGVGAYWVAAAVSSQGFVQGLQGLQDPRSLFSVLTGGWSESQGFFRLAFQRSEIRYSSLRRLAWPGLALSG